MVRGLPEINPVNGRHRPSATVTCKIALMKMFQRMRRSGEYAWRVPCLLQWENDGCCRKEDKKKRES